MSYVSRLAACVHDYFDDEDIRDEQKSSRYPIYKGYKMVLDSKSTDEAQVCLYAYLNFVCLNL